MKHCDDHYTPTVFEQYAKERGLVPGTNEFVFAQETWDEAIRESNKEAASQGESMAESMLADWEKNDDRDDQLEYPCVAEVMSGHSHYDDKLYEFLPKVRDRLCLENIFPDTHDVFDLQEVWPLLLAAGCEAHWVDPTGKDGCPTLEFDYYGTVDKLIDTIKHNIGWNEQPPQRR